IEADPALAPEVLRGRHRDRRNVAPEDLVMMVEPLEPGHDPAAVGLEEEHLEPRMALEDSAADEVGERRHHVEGVRDRLREEDVAKIATGDHRLALELVRPPGAPEAEIATRARHVREQEGMEADRQAAFLRRTPDRVVDRVVELSLLDRR